MSEVNQVKLEKLHTHFQKGGSTDVKDVMNVLKISSEPQVIEYRDALKAKYPEIYAAPADTTDDAEDLGLDEPEETSAPVEKAKPEPVAVEKAEPAAKAAKKEISVEPSTKSFWLKQDDGSAIELSVSNETPTKFILQPKFLKDQAELG